MTGILRLAALCFAGIGILIAVAGLMGDGEAVNINTTILAGLTIYISSALFFAFRKRNWSINRVEGCSLLVLLWTLMPLPLAIAFMTLTDIRFIDAFFEATSALTTTGSSVIRSLDEVPTSVIFLRSAGQWLGGLITLIGVVAIISPSGLGGLDERNAAVMNHDGDVTLSGITKLARTIASAYLMLSLACLITLVLSGVSLFDAFNLAMSTVSSGGFSPVVSPLAEMGGVLTPLVLTIFMALAGSSIIWQRLLLTQRVDGLKAHRETYFYFAAIAVIGILYAAILFERAGSAAVLAPQTALMEGLFTATSLISTTGFEIRNGSFAVLPATVVLMVVLIGGCSFSTAGGITFYRIGGMLSHSLKDLTKLVYPSSVYSSRFGSQRYDLGLIKAIWTYFFTVTGITMAGTILLSLSLPNFEAALIASIAAFSNIGAFYSTGWSDTGQWLAYDGMNDYSKTVLCGLMVLGRLNILTILTALNTTYWFQSR